MDAVFVYTLRREMSKGNVNNLKTFLKVGQRKVRLGKVMMLATISGCMC